MTLAGPHPCLCGLPIMLRNCKLQVYSVAVLIPVLLRTRGAHSSLRSHTNVHPFSFCVGNNSSGLCAVLDGLKGEPAKAKNGGKAFKMAETVSFIANSMYFLLPQPVTIMGRGLY